jgi:hypothetical protein
MVLRNVDAFVKMLRAGLFSKASVPVKEGDAFVRDSSCLFLAGLIPCTMLPTVS